jgi:hypothetical protein
MSIRISRTIASLHETQSVDLSWEYIDSEGASALADALKANISVTKLHLRGNSIGDEGASALADALKANTSVTNLNSAFHDAIAACDALWQRVVRGALHVHSLDGMTYRQYLQSRWAVRQASSTVKETTVLPRGPVFTQSTSGAGNDNNNWFVTHGGMRLMKRPDGTDAIIVVMQQKMFAVITRDAPVSDAKFASMHRGHNLKERSLRSTQQRAEGAHLFCKNYNLNDCTEGRNRDDEHAYTCALDASALEKRMLTCRMCGCGLMPSMTNPHLLRIQLHVPYDDATGFVVLHSTTFQFGNSESENLLSIVPSDTVVADAAMTRPVLNWDKNGVIFDGMQVVLLAETASAVHMLDFSVGDNVTRFTRTELPHPWPIADGVEICIEEDMGYEIINPPPGCDRRAVIFMRTAHDHKSDSKHCLQVVTLDGQIVRSMLDFCWSEGGDRFVSHPQYTSAFAVNSSNNGTVSVYGIRGVGNQPLSVLNESFQSVAMLGNGHIVTFLFYNYFSVETHFF